MMAAVGARSYSCFASTVARGDEAVRRQKLRLAHRLCRKTAAVNLLALSGASPFFLPLVLLRLWFATAGTRTITASHLWMFSTHLRVASSHLRILRRRLVLRGARSQCMSVSRGASGSRFFSGTRCTLRSLGGTLVSSLGLVRVRVRGCAIISCACFLVTCFGAITVIYISGFLCGLARFSATAGAGLSSFALSGTCALAIGLVRSPVFTLRRSTSSSGSSRSRCCPGSFSASFACGDTMRFVERSDGISIGFSFVRRRAKILILRSCLLTCKLL